ncbi:hypothetical protein M0812_13775 [Anaeramoeba flamelloides]|uniref:Ribosome biogenesis protein NOP53 n=1 Tax=Anaeramoeba flamelloides TaxID=1746091 RepID=A0AAV7ZLP7_9EUKA|nr:hypothetical protein M0812_13775 [Anaeramoeba flamelloides]
MSRNKRKKRKWRKVEINQSALSKNKGNKKSNKKGNEFGSIKDSDLFYEDLDDEIKTNKIQIESGKETKKFLSQHKREKHKNKIMDYEKRINKTSPVNKNKSRTEKEKKKVQEKQTKNEKQTKKEQEQKKKQDKDPKKNNKKNKQVQKTKPKKAKNTKAKEKKIVSIWGFDDDQKKSGKKKKNNNWQRFGKNRKFKTHRTKLPDPGQSYNPDPEEHKKFVEKIEKQKQILRNRAKKASTVPKIFDRYVHEENKKNDKGENMKNNQNVNKTKNNNKNKNKNNNNTKKKHAEKHMDKQKPEEKKPKIEKEIILGNVWVISEHDTDKISKELEKKIRKKREKNRRRREIKKKIKAFDSKKNIPSRKRQHLKKKNDKKLNIDKLIENENNLKKKKKRRLLKSHKGLNSIKGWHEIEPVAKLDSNNISLLSVQNQTNLATDHLRQLRDKRITEPRVKKEKKFYKVNTNINGHLLF